MAVTKEDLLKAAVGVQTVHVEGLGDVEYRGLTRSEAHMLQGQKLDSAAADRKLLALAVTGPALSEDEWQEVADKVPAGLLEPVTDAILAASGMRKEDAKAAYAEFRDEP